ncbi:flagellar biosynthesis repressor FlbT [Pontibaca salina]|uniref:Flagellar biosynthesis repressor FlbT n=1 Tax=Pontibaca salina TaxID=2795731 RepID=A0A934M2T1_9RHOB|nr:flagellar biosynthesis repressor FlbT [Pontibaca salina]MBI6630926.1 hypothetical protein [Pontibaca salina]
MGLRLTLHANDRVIVNGSIIRNVNNSRIVIEIENHSDVLRGEEIITQSEATTPVRRLCYFIQVALASPADRDASLPKAYSALDEVSAALGGSQGENLEEARTALHTRNFYKALQCLRPVMAYEDRLLALAHLAE